MSKKLRVKLITIPWELEVPTLTLASIAAVTPERWFDVCIVDVLRERLVLDEHVDLVGITASVPRIRAAYALADYYRSRGAVVVLGGHHVTALPEEGLQHAHAVVCGEGETSWRRICDQMLTNPALVSGIYKDDPPDLTTLPLPRIDLMKLSRYQPFYYPLIASRGCSEQCSFCFAKRMTHGYRTYPIEHVLQQVKRRPRWMRGMYFVDDNLAGDLDYTRELFNELKRLGGDVPFGMQVRHEFSQDPDNVRLAKEAGCGLISSGYESINQHSLNKTGKRANAGLYKEIIDNIQGQGVMASGNWMFGFDWDTPEQFATTWEFLQASEIYHSTFTTEIPFPGTPAYRKYERQGRIVSTRYEDFIGKDRVVHVPKQMSPEALRDGIRWITKKYWSPAHRTRLLRSGMKNPRLLEQFNPVTKLLIFTFMNYYEVYLGQYRSTPVLRRAYDRLLPLYKHRYPRDLVRGTNFWSEPHPPADTRPLRLTTTSPFARRAGQMAPGQSRLQVAVPVES